MVYEVQNYARLEYFPEDKIISIVYYPGVIVDEKIVKEVISIALRMVDSPKFALLIDTRDVMYVTKEAREISATTEAGRIIASAILLNNSILREIFNIFINFNKPLYPTKAFSSYEKAYEWLKTQVENYNE